MVNFHAGSAVMGPWDTMTVQDENAEEEIDMFAVLGAAPPSQQAAHGKDGRSAHAGRGPGAARTVHAAGWQRAERAR